jgi:hypothetical protein
VEANGFRAWFCAVVWLVCVVGAWWRCRRVGGPFVWLRVVACCVWWRGLGVVSRARVRVAVVVVGCGSSGDGGRVFWPGVLSLGVVVVGRGW